MANDKTKETSSWGLGNLIAVVILAGILVIGGSLLGSWASKKQAEKAVAGTQTFQPVVEKTISYDGQTGKNALELLKATHQIETQDSSLGVFITSIDGTANVDNKYWMFYVNGELASQGPDKLQTKDTDKIEWRYEAL